MRTHLLHRRQVVAASLDDCWAFFSDPRKLARITPPTLDFRIVSEVPAAIVAGLRIRYRVRPLLSIPLTWVSEITRVEPPYCFVDEQRVGPYARWHHEHLFKGLEGGRTEILDTVSYAAPFGWLGEIFHPWLIAPRLAEIFAFRERAVERRFGERPGQAGESLSHSAKKS